MKKGLASLTATLSLTILAAALQTLAAAQTPEPQAAEPKQSALERQIIAKEREGLDALKSGDLQAFGNLTAENAVFVDRAGAATKAQVMKNVQGFQLTGYTMDQMSFVPLSKKSGLISYKITEKGVSHGKEFTAQAYVSSIWAEQSGHWLCLFSQETVPK
jgi:ketosteroid isomerase-like protein